MLIHFIGTGAGGSPTSRRWRASTLFETNNSLFLIDCGVGCHYRLSDKGYLTELEHIFITHDHMDHYLGLPELLFQAHMEGRKRKLTIYAPRIVDDMVRLIAPYLYTELNYSFIIKPLKVGLNITLNDNETVRVIGACHRTQAFAYKIEEKGNIRVGYTGDTAEPCQGILNGLSGVDILIHEATCDSNYKELCHRYAHSTNYEAVDTAINIGAKILILNHIDEVFNKNITNEIRKILSRGKLKILIPNDNDTYIF